MDGQDTEVEAEVELTLNQKLDMAKWFLLNSPPGEIQYVAKDVRSVLMDEHAYAMAAAEAFPLHNKSHMISLEMPNRSGQVLVTEFGELDGTHYLDPRTAQVATVNHVKQELSEKHSHRGICLWHNGSTNAMGSQSNFSLRFKHRIGTGKLCKWENK